MGEGPQRSVCTIWRGAADRMWELVRGRAWLLARRQTEQTTEREQERQLELVKMRVHHTERWMTETTMSLREKGTFANKGSWRSSGGKHIHDVLSGSSKKNSLGSGILYDKKFRVKLK